MYSPALFVISAQIWNLVLVLVGTGRSHKKNHLTSKLYVYVSSKPNTPSRIAFYILIFKKPEKQKLQKYQENEGYK